MGNEGYEAYTARHYWHLDIYQRARIPTGSELNSGRPAHTTKSESAEDQLRAELLVQDAR